MLEEKNDAGVGISPETSVNAVPPPVARVSESSDDYPRVVAMLDANTRVIAADTQWIIQKRVRDGHYPWHGVLFFRSKEGLLLYAPKPTAPELLALPDWFPDPTRKPKHQRPPDQAPRNPKSKFKSRSKSKKQENHQ